MEKDDIIVLNDVSGMGNLRSFLFMCNYVVKNDIGDSWYLQDDILLSSNFVKTCMEMRKDIVVNGFVYADPAGNDNYKYVGLQKPNRYWFSFPCCYIPVKYIQEFLRWFDEILVAGKYKKMISRNMYDDLFFWKYMQEKHAEHHIYNASPNLVNHIDYMLGGSCLPYQKCKIRHAYFWNEPEKIEEIQKRINEVKGT